MSMFVEEQNGKGQRVKAIESGPKWKQNTYMSHNMRRVTGERGLVSQEVKKGSKVEMAVL